MPKYTTPPSWYDKNGNLNEMLAGTSGDSTGIAIGKFASVNGEYGVAVGINASVNGGYSVAIGESAVTLDSAIGGIAIGKGTTAYRGDSIAIGEDAKGEAVYGIAIGSGAKANADSTDGIAIGRGTTSGRGGIAIGGSVEAAGINSIAIGSGASTDTDSNNGIAIGAGAMSSQGGIAIGAGADAIGDDMIQLGKNDTAYTLNVGNKNQSVVCAGSYKIGVNTVIDDKRSISGNLLNINNKFDINSDGSVSSKNYIYTTDFVSANSYRINNKSGDYITVIDSDKNITGTSVNVTGSVTGNNIEGNIITPHCLNFFYNKNIAKYYKYNQFIAPVSLTTASKSTSATQNGGMEFGVDLGLAGATAASVDSWVFLLSVSIFKKGAFSSEYSTVMFGRDKTARHIFPVYTGTTDNIGSEWGTIMVTYWATSRYTQPQETDSIRQAYLAYRQNINSEGDMTIQVRMYPIAAFGTI